MKVKMRSNCVKFSLVSVFMIAFAFLFTISAVSLSSTYDSEGVQTSLVTNGSDNWTRTGGNEVFNITVSNTNASLLINRVNITVPASGANAAYNVSVPTMSSTNSNWSCYNVTGDASGRPALITCNTSNSSLVSGSNITIYFNATAPTVSNETVYNWAVLAINESGSTTVSTLLTSGVDGLAPSLIVSSPVNGSNYTTSSISITYQTYDSNGPLTCRYRVDSGSWNYGCSNTTATVSGGSHGIVIYATDSLENSNTSSVNFTLDLSDPTVTLSSPPSGSWDADGGVIFNYTPVDNESQLANCTLWMTDENQSSWGAIRTNTTINNGTPNNFTRSGLSTGTYIWNVRCSDATDHSAFASSNYTLYVGSRSNLIVYAINWTTNPAPKSGSYINVLVTVKNNGTANVANETRLRFCFYKGSSSCDDSPILKNESTVSPTPLAAGGYYVINYSGVPVNESDGTYYMSAEIDTGDNESLEQSNADNSLTEYFSTSLNVTVIAIKYGSTSPAYVNQSQNVTVTVRVEYSNGTGVSGLQLANFSIYDSWENASAIGDNPEYAETVNRTSTFNNTYNGTGVYAFSYAVPGPAFYKAASYQTNYAEFGSHYVKAEAECCNISGTPMSGQSSEDVSLYYLMSPFLRVDISSSLTKLALGDIDTRNITVSNIGSANITGIISITHNESSSYIDVNDWWNPETISGLNASETSAPAVVEFEGLVVVSDYVFYLNASVDYNSQRYWYSKILKVNIVNETAPAGEDNNPTTSQVSGCTTNTSCASSEWCKAGTCTKIVCPSGYTASSHKCVLKAVYEVEVFEFAKAIYVTQGNSTEAVVKVKNTGNQNISVALTAEADEDGVNMSVSPSESVTIPAGSMKTFTVKIIVDEDAKVGNYTITYTAQSTSAAKDTANAVLVIKPVAATIRAIESDYENLTSVVNQLLADFSTIRSSGQLSQDNLTLLETEVNETRTMFEQARAAIEEGDYVQVSMLLDELRSKTSSANNLMQEMGFAPGSIASAFWNNVLLWVVVGVVFVGSAGLFIYMLVPPQGYTAQRGYSHHGKYEFVEKLKHSLSGISAKLRGLFSRSGRPQPTATQIIKRYNPAYAQNYQKMQSGYRPKTQGTTGKFKKLFRKDK